MERSELCSSETLEVLMAQATLSRQRAQLDEESSRQPVQFESGTHRRAVVRPVLEHPDPTLARVSVEVDPTDPAIIELAGILISTMRASPGCIGLSAPQIGENVRMFCVDVTGHRKAGSCAGLVVLANPRIITRAGNIVMREGCLSIPHLTGDVARASEIIVSGVVPGSGRNRILTCDAIEARCVQHEVDHLDGILFVDRVQDPIAELHQRRNYA
jgi:peptide deformylase